MNTLLSPVQRDALQELMNIAMGQAANAMAQLIEVRVILSIPKIAAVTPEQLSGVLAEPAVWLTRQSFSGALRGEVLSLQVKAGVEAIAGYLDFALPLTDNSTEAAVLEVANVLAAACLQGFTSQLELPTRLAPPELYRPKTCNTEAAWAITLLMEVEFTLTDTPFDARVVICLDPESIQQLIVRLNSMLED
jgi:chemotaxis protein CheC